MTKEAKAIQDLLDPTTGAMAVEEVPYPIGVKSNSSPSKHLAVSDFIEIVIYEWTYSTIAADILRNGAGTEIPAEDVIAELDAILSIFKSKR